MSLNRVDAALSALEVFDREAPYWPLELISEASRAHVRQAVAALPPFCTGLFVECHLASDERTDVAARLLPADRDAVLAHSTLARPAPEGAWGKFLKTWQNPDGPIAALPAIDVEIDLVTGPLQPFVCPSFGSRLLQGNTAFYASSAFELAMQSLRVLWPDVPSTFVDNIERVRRELPAGTVFFPGWPLRTRGANPTATIRGFLNSPAESLHEAMRVLRWPGNAADLTSVAQLLCPGRPIVTLDFDLTEAGVSERMGVGYDVPWVRATDRQLGGTLLRLEHSGWCHPRRVAGLAQWVAARRPSEDGLWRALTFKVVLDGPTAPQPKCYLSTFDLG